MDMNNEKRVDEVMKSLDQIRRAEADPFLYTRILNRIDTAGREYAPSKLIWLAAASFLLLVLLNFTLVKKTMSGSGKEETGISEIASGYNLVNENTINYN